MGTLVELFKSRMASGELRPDSVQANAVKKLDELKIRAEFLSKEAGLIGGLLRRAKRDTTGLYLWGGVGRGKSMLMDMFFEQLESRHKSRFHFLEFMQKVHSSLHEIRKTDVADTIPPVAKQVAENLRVLCLDEMHIDDIADAMIVGRLFESLFDMGVVICTTSNRKPDDLYKNGLNRHLFVPFVELVKERMEVHELASDTDYRQERLKDERTYFSPANSKARSVIDCIWNDLSGGKNRVLVLQVKGREVRFPRFSNGAVRATFWEVCAQPLGPADFLALSQAIRALIIEDVPQLSRSNYNEAKRFVLLVDALYEAKVILIVSAAAEPEKLYIEGDGSFEFERTASRLREMQSADWNRET